LTDGFCVRMLNLSAYLDAAVANKENNVVSSWICGIFTGDCSSQSRQGVTLDGRGDYAQIHH
jgi:hypothetical protein